MDRTQHAVYLLQSAMAIRSILESMMGEYFAHSPRGSIGLDETADAVCEVSGIPNPVLFRKILTRTIAGLSPYPDLVTTSGYHVMSCIIWIFCFLSPQALVKSMARLYTSETTHRRPQRERHIMFREVKEMLFDTMTNDPKRDTNQRSVASIRHLQGLFDYHSAVSSLFTMHSPLASKCADPRVTCSSIHEDATVPEDIFVRYFARKHPGALWPLFMIQKQLRRVFLGNDYWKRALDAYGSSNSPTSYENSISNSRFFFPPDPMEVDATDIENCPIQEGARSSMMFSTSSSLDKLELVSSLVNVLKLCEEFSAVFDLAELQCISSEELKVDTQTPRAAGKRSSGNDEAQILTEASGPGAFDSGFEVSSPANDFTQVFPINHVDVRATGSRRRL